MVLKFLLLYFFSADGKNKIILGSCYLSGCQLFVLYPKLIGRATFGERDQRACWANSLLASQLLKP